MTIYKSYLVALRATVTLTYIPVMTTGLYDTFLGPPGTFSGHIRWFPGPFFGENIDILPPRPLNQSRVKYQYFHRKRSRKWTNIPRKRVQGEVKEVLEVQAICLGIQESWLDTKKNFTDPVNLWTNLCKNINIFITNGPGNHLICPGNVPGGPGNVSSSPGVITGI